MSNERREQPQFRPGVGRGPGAWAGFGGLGMPVQKAQNFKGTLWRLIRYFKPHGMRLLVVVFASVFSTVFGIVSPKIMGNAVTDLFSGVMLKIRGIPGAGINFADILHIIETLAALYIFSSVFTYIQQYVMAGVAQKVVYEIRKQVNEKLTRLPLSFFDAQPTGEILSRFVNDFDNIGNTLQQSLTQIITAVITLIGIIVMMVLINLWMTLLVLITLPLSFVITTLIATRSQRYFMAQQSTLGEINSHIEEMLSGHQIVKAFGHEEKSIRTFDEINEKLYEAGWKAQFVSGIIMPSMNFIGSIGFVLVSVAGAIFVTTGTVTIGDVQAFIVYARQFTQPITQLASIANIIQSTIASAERVFELLDQKEESPDAKDALEIEAPRGNVQFQDVQFGYKEDVPVIQDMNVDVQEGHTIAIVGPTGAGKTTLVNLLMRFYELDGGKILIDGVETTQLKRKNLRGMFGMVLQDTWLFHGTIRDNIAYGRENATDHEVYQAARAAHADHFIRTLPDGYQTVLNEEASNLSQGQKQLLTIARAILRDPAILILDEATSSVDTRTEVLIQKAMKELMKGRTSFVIAHRLSTIRDADLILVMNHGNVVEQGNHEELLAMNGFYAELYNSQFAGRSLNTTAV